MAHQPEPVTVMFSRTAKAGNEQAYEAWNRQLIRLSERQPGHVMTSVVAEAHRRYITLQRFDSHESLQNWMQSPQRLERLAALDELTDDATQPVELSGMEPWFRLPGQGGPGHVPRWKMAIVTFCVIYCLVVILNLVVTPHVASLPLIVRSALIPLIMVPLMTYIILPRLTKLLHTWLYSSKITD